MAPTTSMSSSTSPSALLGSPRRVARAADRYGRHGRHRERELLEVGAQVRRPVSTAELDDRDRLPLARRQWEAVEPRDFRRSVRVIARGFAVERVEQFMAPAPGARPCLRTI